MTRPVGAPEPTPEPRRARATGPVGEAAAAAVAAFQASTGTGRMARDQVALASPPHSWTPGRPLSEARNAHATNTKAHFAEALKSDANWFEGDIRTEINEPYALEMRHDLGQESGDNLTLVEWLEAGSASGRGLKLDVKEGARIGEILDLCEQTGVPDGRLMFNFGDGDMAKWGPEIRKRFPAATVAVNPASSQGGKSNDGPLEDWQVQRMIQLGQAAGPPRTFVVRHDLLTDAAIRDLSQHGTISVWNAPSQGGVDDPAALGRKLRLRGVDGVIDLRKSMGLVDKAGAALDYGKNQAKGLWDKVF